MRATVLTRMRRVPSPAVYVVANCRYSGEPSGSGLLCWLTTSKYTASAVAGVSVHSRHCVVPPMPIGTSDAACAPGRGGMAAAAPIAPATRTSLVANTSRLPQLPSCSGPPSGARASSLVRLARKLSDANVSASTMNPPVGSTAVFISARPT